MDKYEWVVVCPIYNVGTLISLHCQFDVIMCYSNLPSKSLEICGLVYLKYNY